MPSAWVRQHSKGINRLDDYICSVFVLFCVHSLRVCLSDSSFSPTALLFCLTAARVQLLCSRLTKERSAA